MLLLAGAALGLVLNVHAASAEVKMAVAAPITGPNATFGLQLKNGADQAVADINAAGGILGQKILLTAADDASEPKQGVSVANKLYADGVSIVIGHFNSSVTMPASEKYNENGMLDITPASTNPQVTERGLDLVFRTCGRDDQQGAVAAKFIVEKLPGKKVAVIHDKSTYGKGLADQTRKALNAAGTKEALYEGITPGEKDYSAIVSKIKAAGADIVFLGGYQTEAGLLIRQLQEQGVKAALFGGDALATDELASTAGPGVEGTYMTFPPDPRNRPEAATLVEKFRAKNYNPETYTLYSYASVQVVQQAATAAKSLEPKAIADTIHSGLTFKTAIGDISFDKKGDVTRADYVVYQWKKGPDGRLSFYEIK
jgi:branched-chain amino acid transport system substrate-binding protein